MSESREYDLNIVVYIICTNSSAIYLSNPFCYLYIRIKIHTYRALVERCDRKREHPTYHFEVKQHVSVARHKNKIKRER